MHQDTVLLAFTSGTFVGALPFAALWRQHVRETRATIKDWKLLTTAVFEADSRKIDELNAAVKRLKARAAETRAQLDAHPDQFEMAVSL